MNDPFNMFFHGEKLSLLEWICMESFIDRGYKLYVHCFEPIQVPPGVDLVDARKTLPYEDFFIFNNSPSAFTNVFRYKLLLQTGGWWVDTDVYCLTADVPNCEFAWAHQDPEQINGAILKFPAGNSVCERLLHLSRERSKSLSAWGQLGPALLTEVLGDIDPEDYYGTQEEFYPTHWIEAHVCWMRDMRGFVESRLTNAVFLHFWHSVLTKMGISLNNRAPEGSFFQKLLMKHQVTCH